MPNYSSTIGKFSEVLEKILKSSAENKGFDFSLDSEQILEKRFRDFILKELKIQNLFAVAETTRREGFIDILVKHNTSEAIIEFKVWGRPKYNQIIRQVLSYGTAWTNEYATVMVNPNKGSICEKFISNAKKSPDYNGFTYIDLEYKPIQKLISSHYSKKWSRYYDVSHFIINLDLLKEMV